MRWLVTGGLVVAVLASWPGSGSGSGPGSSGAARPESVRVPEGWRRLGELAPEATPLDAGGPVRVELREGFGDPSSGCFALVQKVTAPGAGFTPGAAVAAMRAALVKAGLPAEAADRDVSFTRGVVTGRVRTRLGPPSGDRIALLVAACFYNDREPQRCRQSCDGVLHSLGGSP